VKGFESLLATNSVKKNTSIVELTEPLLKIVININTIYKYECIYYSSKGSEKFPACNGVVTSNVNHTSEIKAYNHPLFGNVRMFVDNGKPWFCATDIASSLGYVKPQDAIAKHCKSAGVAFRGVGVQTGLKGDGTPAMQTVNIKFISEGNIYRLIAKSQLPKAEEFESWIFDDLVPTVINTGSYSLQVPQSFSEALMLAAQQQMRIGVRH